MQNFKNFWNISTQNFPIFIRLIKKKKEISSFFFKFLFFYGRARTRFSKIDNLIRKELIYQKVLQKKSCFLDRDRSHRESSWAWMKHKSAT